MRRMTSVKSFAGKTSPLKKLSKDFEDIYKELGETPLVINDEYLKKMLDGKEEEFDETSLVCDLDPRALKNTIKILYNQKQLTFAALKNLLKQGAKFN